MPNSYFQFKQFIIHQNKTSMKVGTDGVLLGAWVDITDKTKILDVGVGTGLLCLMLAQRNSEAIITGIEIDKNAFEQAKVNVEQSTFKHQIKLFHSSFQNFEITNKFDLVICNPPFFKPTYLSGNESRDVARQQINFNINEFLEFVYNAINDRGELALIYPFSEFKILTELAEKKGFYIKRKTDVGGQEGSPFKRVLLQFSKQISKKIHTKLYIEKSRHIYTTNYKKLVKPFYLSK